MQDPSAPIPVDPLVSPLRPAGAARWYGLVLWIGCGLLLFAGLGTAPVTRTQEARVLETAREMLDGGAEQWLVPKVNGNFRLQKPPLAYWLTAVSFKVFDVGEAAGRAPAALAAWLTVGLTALTARRLFGASAAFFAGAALAGSFFLVRFGRLGETDVHAMFFVTASIYALWRGAWAGEDSPESASPSRSHRCSLFAGAGWFHLGAAAMALTALVKGPPAAFPLLFLIAFSIADGRPGALLRFVASGSLLTFAILAIPWFAYVRLHPSFGQLLNDLENSAGGGVGHSGSFLKYFPELLKAPAPWTGVVAVAVVAATFHWRSDRRLRGLLAWAATVFLPLCFWGNKQPHYLLPLLPPLMVIAGWLVSATIGKATPAVSPELAGFTRNVLIATAIGCAAALAGVPIGARVVRGHVLASDWTVAALVAAALVAVVFHFRRSGLAAAVKSFAVSNVVSLVVVAAFWAPSLEPGSPRAAASALRQHYGEGPYVSFAGEELSLVFYLRQIIPVAHTAERLAALAPPPVVIIQEIDKRRPPSPLIHEEMRLDGGRVVYRVGRLAAGPTAPQPAPPAPAGAPGG